MNLFRIGVLVVATGAFVMTSAPDSRSQTDTKKKTPASWAYTFATSARRPPAPKSADSGNPGTRPLTNTFGGQAVSPVRNPEPPPKPLSAEELKALTPEEVKQKLSLLHRVPTAVIKPPSVNSSPQTTSRPSHAAAVQAAQRAAQLRARQQQARRTSSRPSSSKSYPGLQFGNAQNFKARAAAASCSPTSRRAAPS